VQLLEGAQVGDDVPRELDAARADEGNLDHARTLTVRATTRQGRRANAH
jgi:hypothetical protein